MIRITARVAEDRDHCIQTGPPTIRMEDELHDKQTRTNIGKFAFSSTLLSRVSLTFSVHIMNSQTEPVTVVAPAFCEWRHKGGQDICQGALPLRCRCISKRSSFSVCGTQMGIKLDGAPEKGETVTLVFPLTGHGHPCVILCQSSPESKRTANVGA